MSTHRWTRFRGEGQVKVMNSLTGSHQTPTYNALINGTGTMPYPWVGYWIVYGVSCANPVTFVRDFRYEDGVVRWSVLHEWGTKEYVIEGADSPSGEGVPLAVVSPGSSEHSVSVSAPAFSRQSFRVTSVSPRRRASANQSCCTMSRQSARKPTSKSRRNSCSGHERAVSA